MPLDFQFEFWDYNILLLETPCSFVGHVFYPIRVCNGSTTLDLGTGIDGGVGHTAWAPEGREGRYQAGPKGRNHEVF